MPFSTIVSLLKDGLKGLGSRRSSRQKSARRLRRIRQDVERSGALARELQTSGKTAPAYRLPIEGWGAIGDRLMDDGALSEDEYREINAFFDFARQLNIAIEGSDASLHSQTPVSGALQSRPLIKAKHLFEGQPTPYDKALGALSSALDRLL